MAYQNEETETPLPPGTRLGRYQIAGLLGHGGMGSVYEAVHVDLKKRVAIKTLLRKHASNRDLLARFLREGEAASRLRHPNVVDVTDVGEDRGLPYLVMEYLSGESLEQHLKRKGALPLADAVALMLPVLSAVSEGHRKGVVHRDLKPQNIFITSSRSGALVPKVLDFGISKLRDDDRVQTATGGSTFLGTVTYMSPEQVRTARSVDGRSDEYSLAVVLYECVTLRTPHEAENAIELIYKIASGEFQPPTAHVPGLPAAFETVLLRALSTHPNSRYDTMRGFAEAVLPFASEAAQKEWQAEFIGPPRPLTPPPPPPGQAPVALLRSLSGGATLTASSEASDDEQGSTHVRRVAWRRPAAFGALAVLLGGGVWGLTSRPSSQEQPIRRDVSQARVMTTRVSEPEPQAPPVVEAEAAIPPAMTAPDPTVEPSRPLRAGPRPAALRKQRPTAKANTSSQTARGTNNALILE